MMWRQRDGTWIDVRDMSNTHLLNSIRMVHRGIRRIEQVGFDQVIGMSSHMPNGEYAQMAVEQAIDELSNKIFEQVKHGLAIIRRMAGELVNRDLGEIT